MLRDVLFQSSEERIAELFGIAVFESCQRRLRRAPCHKDGSKNPFTYLFNPQIEYHWRSLIDKKSSCHLRRHDLEGLGLGLFTPDVLYPDLYLVSHDFIQIQKHETVNRV